jgi:hypothetical protein
VLLASFTAFRYPSNQSGGAVVVQLDELERNKMAPNATQIMLNKWQNSASYARFFGCNAVQPEPPKLRAGGVGVAGSNPVVPTKNMSFS